MNSMGAPTPLSQPSTAALAEQPTPELMAELLRYAKRRAEMVRRAGLPVPQNYAMELVADVQADTWSGALPWNPQTPLAQHYRNAIKHRTWQEYRHATRVSLCSLHVEAANDEIQIERALLQASPSECSPLMLDHLTATVCQELQAVVAHDVEALAIVNCWAVGVIEMEEVIRYIGISRVAYRSARERLRILVAHVTADLQEVVRDQLRSAA